MRPIEHIRKAVLKLTQAGMADVAGVTQATVSRWESGEFDPSLDELGRIRIEAINRGVGWEDVWFFETPADPAPAESETAS